MEKSVSLMFARNIPPFDVKYGVVRIQTIHFHIKSRLQAEGGKGEKEGDIGPSPKKH